MPPAEPATLDELVVVIEGDGDGDGELRLRVTQPLGGGEAPFRPPFSGEELKRLLPDLERRVRHVHTLEEPPAPRDSEPSYALSLHDIGRRLFESLAQGDVARTLFRALDRVRDGVSPGLRLRLVMDPSREDVAEVAALPWELLFDPRHHRFLARSPDTSVVRFLPVSSAPRLQPGTLPLRVLVAFSNPGDTERLEIVREVEEIRAALTTLDEEVRVEVTEAVSTRELLGRLREGGFHVLHFVGHGDFDPVTGQGRLFFGGVDEPADAVSGRTLSSMLQGLAELRLVVLNSCDTARFERRGGLDPYSGVAQALVQGGLPAVVAMQLPISDPAAIAFSGALYPALAKGRPVDFAVADGRQSIRIEREDEAVEWAAPSLFLQVPDGHILDLQPRPRKGSKDFFRAALVLLLVLAVYGGWRAFDPGFPYRAWLNPAQCPSPAALGRDAAMRFVRVEPGSFWMGSEEGEEDEQPKHRVDIPEPLCVGKFEVTRRQWWQVMDEDPDPGVDPDLPMRRVSLPEALDFVGRLNEAEGSRVFRLPTEEEWEYAARAGTPTAYSFGDDPAELPEHGNCLSPETGDDSRDRTAPVGSFEPNRWGLYDVHGNVQEWVGSPYEPYPGGGPLELERHQLDNRVRRGGSYDSDPDNCRSAARNPFTSDRSDLRNGLRVVREPV